MQGIKYNFTKIKIAVLAICIIANIFAGYMSTQNLISINGANWNWKVYTWFIGSAIMPFVIAIIMLAIHILFSKKEDDKFKIYLYWLLFLTTIMVIPAIDEISNNPLAIFAPIIVAILFARSLSKYDKMDLIGWYEEFNDHFICINCSKESKNFKKKGYKPIRIWDTIDDIYTCDKCDKVFYQD